MPMAAAGTPAAEAERQRGDATLELRAGRWTGREASNGFVWKGTYSVDGNVVHFATTTCMAPSDICFPGTITAFTWSVYRDRLALAAMSGPLTYFGLFAKPLTRAR
jgi:hypothetical protein